MKSRLLPCAVAALVWSAVAQGQSGSLDITFNPGEGISTLVLCIAVEANGKILIGGLFHTYDGESRNYVARLNGDGSLDPEFLPLEGPNEAVRAIALAGGGKVLIGGDFGGVNGITRRSLARLRADGSLDLAFPNAGFDSRVTALERLADGKYLVVGEFSQINGSPFNRVARLFPDGAVDAGFNPASRISNGMVLAAAVQSDGKVVLAGSFRVVDNADRIFVARVNDNGMLDASFDAGFIGGSSISQILIQQDGKIIVAGDISSVDGYSRSGVARLNADGSVDRSFALLGGSIRPSAAALQPDGKCIFGGSFSVGAQSHLVRLNTNGTMDPSFPPVLDGNVTSLALQADGKVLIGGTFNHVGRTNINHIARLNGDTVLPVGLQLLAPNKYFGALLAGTVSNTYRIEWTADLNTPSLWAPLFNVMLTTNTQFILDPGPITGRQRFYRAVGLPE